MQVFVVKQKKLIDGGTHIFYMFQVKILSWKYYDRVTIIMCQPRSKHSNCCGCWIYFVAGGMMMVSWVLDQWEKCWFEPI